MPSVSCGMFRQEEDVNPARSGLGILHRRPSDAGFQGLPASHHLPSVQVLWEFSAT